MLPLGEADLGEMTAESPSDPTATNRIVVLRVRSSSLPVAGSYPPFLLSFVL